MQNRHSISEKAAWDDPTHAEVFDYLHGRPTYLLKKHFESFNEGRLLQLFQSEIRGKCFFEFGCATGELYRYLRSSMRRFEYTGFDISSPAIKRANEKYPEARFILISGSISDVEKDFGRPNVIWCRDVILHLESPYAYLNDLIALSKEALFLRLRTRDVGETVTNSQMSCQLHWDKSWVPYIVLNTREMIAEIIKHEDVKRVVVSRNYEVLGGQNFRYLPKELYFSSARAAETAVFIQKGKRTSQVADVAFMDEADRPTYTLVDRVVLRIARRLAEHREKR